MNSESLPTVYKAAMVSSDIREGTLADPRLMFTGPSPFGGHRYVLFDTCPRKYGLDHSDYPMPYYDSENVLAAPPTEEGEEGKSAWELIRGTTIHTGLAHHYARKQAREKGDSDRYNLLYSPLESMEALHAQERERAHYDDRSLWDDALVVSQRVYREYAKRFAFERAKVEVVEEVFVMELGESKAPYTFRLDLGLRDSNQKVWMVDHKSTTRLRTDHGWIYGISAQFQAYAIGGRAVYGANYGGVMANMMEMPDPEDSEGRAVFSRPQVPQVTGFLAGFAERISGIYERMQDLVKKGIPPELWPKRPGTHTCKAYGRICPYYEKCSSSLD